MISRSVVKQKKEKRITKENVHTFKNINKIVVRSSSLSISIIESVRDDVKVVSLVELEKSNVNNVSDNEVYTNDETLYFKQGETSGISILSVYGTILIEVPLGFAMEYELANANADITLDAPTMGLSVVSNVNGKTRIKQGGDSLNLKTAGGSVKIEAPFVVQKINSVSGKISTICDAKSEKLEANSINGNIKIQIPAGVGCSIDHKTLSGSIEVSDSISAYKYNKSKSSVMITVSAICGNIKIIDAI